MSTQEPSSTRSPLDDFQILVVPGRGNSGTHHWQTHLESELVDARRVVQIDWLRPRLDVWSQRVAQSIERSDKPVLIVAHSFGCLASVAASLAPDLPVAGALLAAPADPGRFNIDEDTLAGRLPFPSTLVLSRDDPWLDFEVGRRLGARWGARIVDVGHAGHINVDSGFGPWPLAHSLLKEMAAAAEPTAASLRAAWLSARAKRAVPAPPSRARRGRPRTSPRRG